MLVRSDAKGPLNIALRYIYRPINPGKEGSPGVYMIETII